jgi:ParB-like chromosome segregation protein Spo0J
MKNDLKIEWIKIGLVKPNPENPRIIKDDKFKKLVKSIDDFPEMLELRPIIINDDNIVLGGNMRLKALQELKYKEVPVVKATDLTKEQEKEFIVKDNVGFGEWDWDILANEWNAEELSDWGLDIPDMKINEEKEEIEDIKTEIVLKYDAERFVTMHKALKKSGKKKEDLIYELVTNANTIS